MLIEHGASPKQMPRLALLSGDWIPARLPKQSHIFQKRQNSLAWEVQQKLPFGLLPTKYLLQILLPTGNLFPMGGH